MKQKSQPRIFDYMDAVFYLKAYYDFRKSKDSKFSFTVWSEEAGFGGKTLLRQIVHRQRKISASSADRLRRALMLSDLEGTYFDTLIAYSQARGRTEKEALGVELMNLQRRLFRQQEISAASFQSLEALTPVLLALASFEERRLNVEEMSAALGASPESVAGLLQRLMASGLIREEDGRFAAMHQNFKVPDSWGSRELRKYHEHWIAKSLEAFDFPFDTRSHLSLIFALDKSSYERARELIQDFAHAVLSKFESEAVVGKRLYMLNTALMPVSAMVMSSERRAPAPTDIDARI